MHDLAVSSAAASSAPSLNHSRQFRRQMQGASIAQLLLTFYRSMTTIPIERQYERFSNSGRIAQARET